MKTPILAFVMALAVLLVLDVIWIGSTLDVLYKPNMPGMVRDAPNFVAAAAFYLIYASGLVYLVIAPTLKADEGFGKLSARAAVYGLAAFATYDLTGLSVLNNWSLKLSLIDMAWGTFAAVTASTATVFLLRAMGRGK